MIEIKNLSFDYGKRNDNVFSDLNLEFNENGVYGLLGKNGTGKTTLLYLICGLLRCKKGTIKIYGDKSVDRKARMYSKIFLIPENPIMPTTTMLKYAEINRPFYPNFNEDMLRSNLKEFGVDETAKLNELSMGQAKKAYIAFGLATNTEILLMDEPTNGLDIPSKTIFRQIMAKEMREDRTVIISTHQVHDIEQLIDHITVIDKTGLRMNESVSDICSKYVFENRFANDINEDVIYSEPSIQGYSVIAKKGDNDETNINLELLFNAITNGKI